MAMTTGAARRRSAAPQQAGAAPTVPGAASAGQGTQAPNSPAAAVPVQAKFGVPSAASTWTNPYPTSYAAVPIASPPANPNLTSMDVSNQIAEYSDWDKYLSGIGLQAANMSAEATTKVQDIEQAMAQSLENNNWDTASRGIAQSGIRDSDQTKINADAAVAKGGVTTGLSNFQNYAAGEQAKWGTQIKPGIDAKYTFIGGENARAASEANAASQPVAPPAAPPAAPGPASGHDSGPTKGNQVPVGGANSGVQMQTAGERAGQRFIMKDGVRFYESKPGAGDWGNGGKIRP